MKRKIIVAVVVALAASVFGLQSGLLAPVVDGIYCYVQPNDCK